MKTSAGLFLKGTSPVEILVIVAVHSLLKFPGLLAELLGFKCVGVILKTLNHFPAVIV